MMPVKASKQSSIVKLPGSGSGAHSGPGFDNLLLQCCYDSGVNPKTSPVTLWVESANRAYV